MMFPELNLNRSGVGCVNYLIAFITFLIANNKILDKSNFQKGFLFSVREACTV